MKSYWIQDVETDKVYLQTKDKLKLKQWVLTIVNTKRIEVEISDTPLKELLKDPSFNATPKHVTFSPFD